MGRRVKRLRTAQGMTGLIQDVRSQVVVKLAKALGVPVTELLK